MFSWLDKIGIASAPIMVPPGAVSSFTKVVVLPYRRYADALRCGVGGPSGIGSSKPLPSGFERPDFGVARIAARVLRRLHISPTRTSVSPTTSARYRAQWEKTIYGTVRAFFRGADGSLSVLANCEYPNGLDASPDDHDVRRQHTWLFCNTSTRSGSMTPATWSGVEPGIPYGLKVDSIGRVYSHRPGGVRARMRARLSSR